MRTTITVPDSLFQDIERAMGEISPSKAVIKAFKEFLRRRKIHSLMKLQGKVKMDITLDEHLKLRRIR